MRRLPKGSALIDAVRAGLIKHEENRAFREASF
jgi:hypothetical protein